MLPFKKASFKATALAALMCGAAAVVEAQDAQSGWAGSSGVVGAGAAGAGSALSTETIAYADTARTASSDLSAAAGNGGRRRRRKNRRRKKNKQAQEQRQAVDYEYDRDDSYGAPKAPASGYNAPSSGYGAPAPSNEAPAPSYSAPSYSAPSYSAPSYKEDSKLEDFLNALTLFLPLGLFLSAIPPNIINISVSTGKKRRRKRDLGYEEDVSNAQPFLKEMSELGVAKMMTKSCQKKIFCEMAYVGGDEEYANYPQKLMRQTVERTPRFMASMMGLSELFDGALTGKCDNFGC